jgi:tetratricopeptide (TPR) repeat protein
MAPEMTSSVASLRKLLQQGLQARNAGHVAQAQAAYQQVLSVFQNHPDALFLMGELEHSRGNLTQAEGLLERSLEHHPLQPQVWSFLGKVREDLLRSAEAVDCYLRAAELQPTLVDAHFNAARLLQQQGRSGQARECLARVLARPETSAPLAAQALQLQAVLQEEAGQLDSAMLTLEEALQLAPQRAALHHNRATLLQRMARPSEALAAHDTAIALGLDVANAHYNRGNCLQSLGRLSDALHAYLEALKRDPQHELAMFDVARLRWRLGDPSFTAEIEAASILAPQSAIAPGIKGRLMLRAGRFAEAAAAYSLATRLDPLSAGYPDGQAQALRRLGHVNEALALHQQAIALAPSQAAPLINHAASLLQGGHLAQATEQAEHALRMDPLNQEAWAFLGVAWRAAGDPREAWLNSYQEYVQAFELSPPPGWVDLASFNRALRAALELMHRDAQAPIDQTLRVGSQTLGNIFDQSEPLVLALKAQIARAVYQYIERLRGFPKQQNHPLLSRVSRDWHFSDSWSSRLRSSGFHLPHVHPHGWISSVYYVALPPSMSANQPGSNAGWLTFGEPDVMVPGCLLGPRRLHAPVAGQLVLFPSFMWHGTLPFEDEEPRLTVAFDVLPSA